jgi:Uma2 family endonuclease
VVTFIDDLNQVSVPSWVVDLESFRRWADTEDFPEKARIWYLKGEVLVNMSKEQLFSHLAVKQEFSLVLGGLVKAGKLGSFFPDGLFLSNIEADIGGNPDGTFVATKTFQSEEVRLIEGAEEGYAELEGSPDMVLEVVSASSVSKDTKLLRQAYWEAGIREYWLVDARSEPVTFEILRHTAKGYAAARKQDGWQKSAVFGKAFRLTQDKNALGHPEFTLEVR